MNIDTSHQSPNFSSRGGHRVEMLVLHATVGSYASALSWLINPASKVSSHYLIRKDGHTAQLVSDKNVAWHAGKSAWHGIDSDTIALCSIGIELENNNSGHDPYPLAQLDSCRLLCRSLIARYAIERGDVVRHLDIAIPKGRKTDPAGFPWPQFVASLYTDAPPSPPNPQPPTPIHRYRVLATVTGGATIRAFPRVNAAILGRLRAGDAWEGEAIEAKTATFVQGFGSSRVWIRALDQRCVWSGLLEHAWPDEHQ